MWEKFLIISEFLFLFSFKNKDSDKLSNQILYQQCTILAPIVVLLFNSTRNVHIDFSLCN